MILRRLSLKNYRNYRSLEVEFPTGLIGVVGRNGAGKTTLIEAVAFALYGSEASRTKAKGVRRDGVGRDEACEVELEFSVAGDAYRIIRRLRGTNEIHQAEIYRGSSPEVLATQASGVQTVVRKLLGMDYGTFTRSVFSKQNEVNALSDARPEERRKAIQRMVGVDILTRARDAARAERREKEAEVEGARRAIEALPGKRVELEDLGPRLKAARGSVSETRQIAVAAADAARDTRATLNRLDRKRSKNAVMEKEASGLAGDHRGAEKREQQLRNEIASLTQARDEFAELLPKDREFERVRREKEAMDRASGKHEERVQLVAEVEDVSADRDDCKRRLESARKTMAKFHGVAKTEKADRAAERKARAALGRQQKARGRAQKEMGGAESQAMKAKSALVQVRKLGPMGKCPTCYRNLGDSFAEIVAHLEAEQNRYVAASDAARTRLDNIDVQIRSTNRSIEEAVRQVRSTANAANQAAQAKERLVAARDRYARVVRNLHDKGARLRMLARVRYDESKHRVVDQQYSKLSPIHDKVEALRQKVSRIGAVKGQLRSTRREMKRLIQRIHGVERRRAALGFDPAVYSAARKAYDAAQAEDKSAALAHSTARGKLGQLVEGQRRLRDEIRRLEQFRARIVKDEDAIRYLTRIEALLDDFRVELINRVRPQIEEHASLLFERLTDGRYPRIVLDEDYSISIHDGTGVYPIRRFSGGEEDLTNLCLRIAISEVVAQRAGGDTSSLVVLDEIFGSQDAERRERILQALGRLEATFQQIVLITHMEDIHDRVAHVLRVAENAAREAEAAWM